MKSNKNSSRKESSNKNCQEESKSLLKTNNQANLSKNESQSTSFDEKTNFININYEENPINFHNIPEKEEHEFVIRNILNLRDYNKREEALRELCKKKEKCSYLAAYIWFSFGTSTILLVFIK